MKTILTLATPEILHLCEPLLANQRAYAHAQGYEHFCATSRHWTHLHPSFTKVHLIREALKENEIVIWADADVAFMDRSVDLASLLCIRPLEENVFMAGYQQNNWRLWKYICAGLTVWKKTEKSQAFVEEWFFRCEHGTERIHPGQRVIVDYPPWEQWYMDEIIRETQFHGIYAATAAEIGCFCPEMWHDGIIWQPGYPTIHFAGQAPWERRVEIFETTYAPLVKEKVC